MFLGYKLKIFSGLRPTPRNLYAGQTNEAQKWSVMQNIYPYIFLKKIC